MTQILGENIKIVWKGDDKKCAKIIACLISVLHKIYLCIAIFSL